MRFKASALTHLTSRLLAAAGTLAVLTSLAHAKGSLDAIQLENIPLDASVDCSRTFFKSSRNFNGTIYVMPHVVPEAHDDEHEAFDIESDGKGHYTLAMSLYFPRNDEQVRNNWDTEFDKTSRCNFDVVKAKLNEDIEDPSQKIKRIAPMPLTSMDVSLPGASQVGRIGRSLEQADEVDLLDYDGASLPVEIPLTAEEKEAVTQRLSRVDGIPVRVRFRFQARSRQGGVNATIDWKKLAGKVSASLAGQRVVARAEFNAALQASIESMAQSITVDSGETPAFDKIAGQIIDTVLAQAKNHTSEELPKAGEEKSASSILSVIDVKVAVEALSSQSSSSIHYEQNSAPETATAETVVRFHSHLRDPNLREVRVRAGFANPTLEEPIRAGQTIKITPAYHFLARFEFSSRHKTYLTTSQIEELRLSERFGDLSSDQMTIENRTVGSHLMAVGKWTPLAGYSPVYSPARYMWRRTEKARHIMPDFGRAFSPDLETLRRLPITIAFSNFGGRFAAGLADLIGDHPMWSAVYDSNGTIVLTAKKDLGQLTFLEHFASGQESIVPGEKDLVLKDTSMDEVVEERHALSGETSVVKSVVLRNDPITILQSRFVVFNVSHALDATAAIPLQSR